MSRSLFPMLCGLLVTLPLPAADPGPVEELLRHVPPDVTFCMVLRDLRGHAEALEASPLTEQMRKGRMGDMLTGAPELQQLAEVDRFLQKHLKVTAAQLRDDFFGDAVVLAYRPGPPGKPEEEQGLLLLRARKGKALADLITRLDALLKETGDLKSMDEREHDGQKYFRRVEKDSESFHSVQGPVLVFSGQESMLKQALTAARKAPADRESAVGKQLRLMGADKALFAVWLNPRGFDAELAAQLAEAKGPKAAFWKTFAACWKGLDGVALTVSLTKDVEFALTLRADSDALPGAVRRFLDELATRSDLWSRFPEDALLAVGARTSLAALLDLLASFQTKEAFAALQEELNLGLGTLLNKNVVTEVSPHLGPDWGFSICAPPREDKAWFPSMLFALRVARGDPAAPLDRSLLGALDSYARIAVLAHNQQRKGPLKLTTVKHDKLEVHYLASDKGGAMGLQPAFGLHDGYLVLASSPETIRRFAAQAPAQAGQGEVPLLRLSIKDLRQYLSDRREALTTALAEQNQQPVKDVAAQLDGLLSALTHLDRVELTQKTTTGQATLTLRLRTSPPLRK